MKRLKLIMIITLVFTAVAVTTASINLVALYSNEKRNTMETVKECAENAVLLEMIKRMQRSNDAPESFIRLNAFIESVQQKDGRIAKSDTLRTSLASIMRFGLEFPVDKTHVDLYILDSIFHEELKRHDLNPDYAAILPSQSKPATDAALWKTTYIINPAKSPDYDIYVSPMRGKVFSGMWGIIIPFIAVICMFSFLTFYLEKMVRHMKSLEQMKDDFTHNMTHELKTPVAVAYSAADSMLRYYDGSNEARNRQFLNIILQRLSFLSGMIENILSMSMERFKTMKLNIETVSVKPMVTEITELMKLKAGKPISVDIDIPDNLSIRTDSLHFGNVVSNLMDNAIKYSNDTVKITIKADKHSFSITDDGIGIDRKNLPFIFDKFYRVTSGDRYETGGYGLGLFYVKQVVGLLGWSIKVYSKPGQGSTFTIKFNDNEER